jgi:Cu-processing system permease protein
MTHVWRAAKPQIRSVIRSRWLISYFLFFLLVTEGLLRFTGGDARTLLSLANITLFIVPLVTLVYGTIFLYSSRELVELLLAQPLKRRTLFAALYAGLTIPLISALVAGLTIPFLFHGFGDGQRVALLTLTLGAAGLTAVFTGIAFCVALKFQDRLTGLGAALAVWFFLALLYDGALLFIIAKAGEPLEKTLLAATLANPIDLVRIALLLQFDISALMGHTGAAFSRFFAASTGSAVITVALLAWIALPLGAGFYAFRRKDF